MWLWLISLCLFCCVSAKPAFLVTFPAVSPVGSRARLCASLVYPNETLHMSIVLEGKGQNNSLLEVQTHKTFHQCVAFQTPEVQEDAVQLIRVVVEGQAFRMVKESKIMFRAVQPVIILQTDKPIYKAGQTVNFRIAAVNRQLEPVDMMYDAVQLQDPNFNIINQWSNISSRASIVQLSHPLSSEPSLGTYRLLVLAGQQRTERNFRVLEYVLPRFSVQLDLPPEANVGDAKVLTEACAKYTYGQPVLGNATMELCRKGYVYTFPPPPVPQTKQKCDLQFTRLNTTGCASFSFNLSEFLNIGTGFEDHLALNVTVTEEGTGVVMAETGSMVINYTIGKVDFVNTPSLIVGSNLLGSVKAVSYNDLPIAQTTVYLYKAYWSQSTLLLNVTTDQTGVANFSLSLASDSDEDIQIVASLYPPNDPTRYVYQKPAYQDGIIIVSQLPTSVQTMSSLYVKPADGPLPCGKNAHIDVQYTVVRGKAWPTLDLIFLAVSRGAIVHAARSKVAQDASRGTVNGEAFFHMIIQPGVAPLLQVLAYIILPTGEVVAGSRDFPTENCFRNKVSLRYSLPETVPGEKTMLRVAAQPGSLCGLAIVDQSVLLIDSEKRLNADYIFNMLHQAPGIPFAVQDQDACLNPKAKRSPTQVQGYNLPRPLFEDLGLKVATNLLIALPSCVLFMGQQYHHYTYTLLDRENFARADIAKMPAEIPDSARSFFPETWLWKLVNVGASGATLVRLTAPDTITTWETDAFCLSPRGLGVAPAAQLTVFKPFFLDVTLPYSIVRGENFLLKATVYNYMTSCIMVNIVAPSSTSYVLEPCTVCVYESCVCGSETQTFQWYLIASAVGFVNVTLSAQAVNSQQLCNGSLIYVPQRGQTDTVIKTLLVKAEGVPTVQAQSWLLCPENSTAQQTGLLQLPLNVVNGSASASVFVIGDVLGHAIQNLDNLLEVPRGCGEQNMGFLAPDICILEYLEVTGQLTATIRRKATDVLKTGYQNQLNYRDSDGGYSTFGNGDTNNWLTAFVYKTLSKAQAFIYIDPSVLEKAKAWILTTKKVDGCFKMVGRLYNSGLKGGVDDEITLTAYISAAMLESGSLASVINDSLACLRSDTGYLNNTYTAALLAYTFSLAGDVGKSSELLQHLKLIAIDEDGFIHWSQASLVTSMPLSVEISAYVLLAILTPFPVSTADLGYASSIVRWLVKQQNPYGGFYSTQDTVVALQALGLYAALTHGSQGSSMVIVKSASGLYSFTVNEDNRLVYQSAVLNDTAGNFSIVVNGTGCASVQVTLNYNVPAQATGSAFNIYTNVTSVCRNGLQGEVLSLGLNVTYTGQRNITNMVLVDISVLSGFVPDPDSIKEIRSDALVDRVDMPDGHVILYLKEMAQNASASYILKLTQELQVENLSSAMIEVFDYYETSEMAMKAYTSPCGER